MDDGMGWEWSLASGLRLYRSMCRIRSFEEAVREAVLSGEVCGSSHLYTGEEAIAAGVCQVLDERDRTISTFRGHGHCVARGGDLNAMMAEVFGRATGLGGGRLGSLHLAQADRGMVVADAIVGGGAPIAVGVAFAQRYLATGGVTVVFFGDGASDHGTVHEAMNLAALWKLPVVFACENNQIAYFTPQDEHQAILDIATRAAGYGMPGEVVDGNDAAAVAEASARAVARARAGEGPTLLEFKTYRVEGHFVGDGCPYRDASETERWVRERDPIELLDRRLVAAGVAPKTLEAVRAAERANVAAAVSFARESPFPQPENTPDLTYADPSPFERADGRLPRLPDVEEGEPATISFSKAMRQALDAAMAIDGRVFCAGEDIVWGGSSKLFFGLAQRYPGRVLNTPISETAIAGLGLGAAAMGLRPVLDFNVMDFTLCAADELVNQIAKLRHLSAGLFHVPLVIHVSCGSLPDAAAQHAQALEALYAHAPGLKVVVASNPADAKGLLTAALEDPDPVVFIDGLSYVGAKAPVASGRCWVPLGSARVARAGSDVCLVAYGSMVATALKAADQLAREGISAEVVDLRSLVPLDRRTLAAAASACGRVVVATEAVRFAGLSAEVAASIEEDAFGSLVAPVVRLGAPFRPIPYAPQLKEGYYVQADAIAAAARSLCRR